MTTFHRTWWGVVLIVFPLAFDPRVFFMNPGASLALLLPAKVVVLTVSWLLGVVILLRSYPKLRLLDLPHMFLKARAPFKLLWLLLLLVLVSPFLQIGGAGTGFLGSDVRLDGALIQAAWLSLVLISAGLFQTRRVSASWVIGCLEAGAMVIAAMAIVRGYGTDLIRLMLRGAEVTAGSGTFLGHPGMASGYLAFSLIVIISFRAHRGHIGWRAYIAALLLSYGLFSITGRSAIVALVLTLIGVAMWTSNDGNVRRRILALAGIAALALAPSYLLGTYAQSRIDRFATVAQGSDVSTQNRAILLRAGVDTLRVMPFWGIGPEQFQFAVWHHVTASQADRLLREVIPPDAVDSAHRTDNALIYMDPETGSLTLKQLSFDKSHNYVVDFLLSFGWLAGICLIAFTIASTLTLARSSRRCSMALAALSGLVFFLVFGLAWFGAINYDPIFWVVVGTGLAATEPQRCSTTDATTGLRHS